jgi:hypothetical protein
MLLVITLQRLDLHQNQQRPEQLIHKLNGPFFIVFDETSLTEKQAEPLKAQVPMAQAPAQAPQASSAHCRWLPRPG